VSFRPTKLAALAAVFATSAAIGQWEIEADPLAYGASGFSAHVARRLDHGAMRLQLGVFGADVPAWLHGEDDFDLRVRGVTAKVDYFPSGRGRGFFVGADADYSRLRYRLDQTREAVERNITGIGPRVGYRFEPSTRLYVTPWISIRYLLNADDVVISGRRFEVSDFAIFPTVHLGWQF
jgi:hypothetical protein